MLAIAALQRAAKLSFQASGQRKQTLHVRSQRGKGQRLRGGSLQARAHALLRQQAAQVAIALRVFTQQQQRVAFDLKLGADDRAQARFFGGFAKARDAVHAAAIPKCQRWIA